MSARSAAALPLSAEPIRPGVWRVASSRPGEPPYEVQWFGGDGGGCTCPGYQRWHHCKHLDLVRSRAGPRPAPRRERAMQANPRALTRVEPPQPPVVEEPSRALTNLTVPEMLSVSKILLGAAGFLPKGITTEGQVFAVIATGQELGVAPMGALRHLPLVEGKPDPSAELLLALIRHRYGPATIRVAESTPQQCTIEWRQPGWDGIQSFTWTLGDAERAGLTRKDVWQKYPAAMNRSRALKHVARMAFPEVALGLELGGEELAPDVAPVRRHVEGGPTEAEPATSGLLSAEELQPGGPSTGERGGVVGEVVGMTKCAICGAHAECLYDAQTYICADAEACKARRAAAEAPAPAPRAPAAAGADSATADQLASIRAHLERTGRSEAALVETYGHSLERLSRADASALLRDLGKVPNAGAKRAPAADAEQVAF